MINFLKYRYLCLVFSIAIFATGAYFYVVRGGFSYSIDFTGGSELRIAFETPQDIAEVRRVLSEESWQDLIVQNLEGSSEFIVRVDDVSEFVESKVTGALSKAFGDSAFKVVSVEKVGPEAGSEIRYNAIISVILTLIGLAFYMAFRQRYAYALGAVAALAHDVLVILTYYLVMNEPISLNVLTGILSVLGYSVNDTVIVFCRIRDNLGLSKKMSGEEIVNLSLNQTLSRTLLTSFTTFLTMVSLFFLGGPVLKSFSVTMMLGIFFGTYSSIYIASTVMLYFNDQFKGDGGLSQGEKPSLRL